MRKDHRQCPGAGKNRQEARSLTRKVVQVGGHGFDDDSINTSFAVLLNSVEDCVRLAFKRGLMWPTPTASAQAATAQVTDRRSLFGDEHRISLGEYENPGPELSVVGAGREIAERERLQYVSERFGATCAQQHMIVRPERRVAKRFRSLGNRDD